MSRLDELRALLPRAVHRNAAASNEPRSLFKLSLTCLEMRRLEELAFALGTDKSTTLRVLLLAEEQRRPMSAEELTALANRSDS